MKVIIIFMPEKTGYSLLDYIFKQNSILHLLDKKIYFYESEFLSLNFS